MSGLSTTKSGQNQQFAAGANTAPGSEPGSEDVKPPSRDDSQEIANRPIRAKPSVSQPPDPGSLIFNRPIRAAP
jgi:hypothetical protein